MPTPILRKRCDSHLENSQDHERIQTAFNESFSRIETIEGYFGPSVIAATLDPTVDSLPVFNVATESVVSSTINEVVGAAATSLGLGNVVGPASATNGDVVVYDGATGKLIKDTGVSATNLAHLSDIPAAYTDEQAQDAIGAMVGPSLIYVDGTPLLARAALTGDITAAQDSNATTLATVNSNIGTFGSATKASVVTVNGKGLVTAASESTVTPAVGSITGLGPNVATFLVDPSSANLRGAITDETGAGAAVFADSPALTGTPTTPTAAGGTNTTQIASTAFVTTAVSDAVTGLLDFKGATDCSGNPNYPAASKGDAYVVSVAGKIGGASGASVDAGDMFLAIADNAGGTQAAVGASWKILEHNLAGALLSANNLSDVASAATAVDNLGGAASTGSGGLVRATSPTLVTPNIGNADTTLDRVSAGVISCEGHQLAELDLAQTWTAAQTMGTTTKIGLGNVSNGFVNSPSGDGTIVAIQGSADTQVGVVGDIPLFQASDSTTRFIYPLTDLKGDLGKSTLRFANARITRLLGSVANIIDEAVTIVADTTYHVCRSLSITTGSLTIAANGILEIT